MKRDMDLIRLIMLEIEKNETTQSIDDLSISQYDMETVAYHCKLLYEKGLVSYYDDFYSSEGLCDFQVGSLTWEGHDFLDKIRDNSIWSKTKDVIKRRGLPLMIETIKEIANAFISSTVEGTVNAIMKNGGI